MPTTAASPRPPSPADPALAFAERAAQTLGPALIHYQEARLAGQSTPVVIAVLSDVSRAAAVAAIFQETSWSGSTPNLHVLDQATWASLQQLADAGMITFNTRATRHLSGEPHPPRPRILTAEERQRLAELHAFAAKKRKVARLLIAEGLADEAAPHQQAAEKALAEAEKIEHTAAN